jgi:sugar phosphate isomerase/epimerase
MIKRTPLARFGALAVALAAAAPSTHGATSLFAKENLLAWCIVPYDSQHRGPAERIAMLQRLGFTQYVWDWRARHLEDLPEELRLAREAGVRVRGVWLWIDETKDRVGGLGANNEAIFAAVAEAGTPMEYWVGFHDNVFEGLDDEAREQKGVAFVRFLRDRAVQTGGTVALYNHGGWFGEPENQLRIIAAVGDDAVGMVYNFHHAHDHLERFAGFLPAIVPHLRAVNLNGMRPEGPKILPIGAGTHEREMLRQLAVAGYSGPLGIIGHVDDADVEETLRTNLEGLRRITAP